MRRHSDGGNNGKFIAIILTVVIVILAGLSVYFFKQYKHLKDNPDAVSQDTAKHTVQMVGKIYAVPTDEEPTVAEVKDKEKLKDQAFFKGAQNGDKILIYTKNKVAIIYRENDNKIINVGPIALSDKDGGEETKALTTVKVINGSSKTNKVEGIVKSLEDKMGASLTIDSTYGDAKNKNVTKTTVIAVNADKAATAQEIATALGGQVGQLPAGESKPNTDILVITGQ